MAERASWAVGSDTERILGTEDARLAIGALWTPADTGIDTRAGFTPAPSSGYVSASSPTADTAVHVSAFQYVLPSTRGTGAYIMTLDASKTIDVLTANPADPSNPRHDLIVAQQNDAAYSDADSTMTVRLIVGTASATPADPTVDGSPDYVALARITVPAGAAAITSADITDLRPTDHTTVAAGGILPIFARDSRPTAPYVSQTLYRTGLLWHEVFDGSTWRVVGPPVADTIAALESNVSDPYQGLVAVTRDTNDIVIYDGAAWRRPKQSGSVVVDTSGAADGTIGGQNFYVGSTDVVFEVPYAAAPNVIVAAQTSVPGVVLEASAASITATGFTAYLARTTQNTNTLYWIATEATQ